MHRYHRAVKERRERTEKVINPVAKRTIPPLYEQLVRYVQMFQGRRQRTNRIFRASTDKEQSAVKGSRNSEGPILLLIERRMR